MIFTIFLLYMCFACIALKAAISKEEKQPALHNNILKFAGVASSNSALLAISTNKNEQTDTIYSVIHRSIDDGLNWENIHSVQKTVLNAVTVGTNGNAFVVGHTRTNDREVKGVILFSSLITDYKTWSDISLGSEEYPCSNYLSVSSFDGITIFAICEEGTHADMYISTDVGQTWVKRDPNSAEILAKRSRFFVEDRQSAVLENVNKDVHNNEHNNAALDFQNENIDVHNNAASKFKNKDSQTLHFKELSSSEPTSSVWNTAAISETAALNATIRVMCTQILQTEVSFTVKQMILGIGRSQLMNDAFALQAFAAAVAKALSSKGGSVSPSQINIINIDDSPTGLSRNSVDSSVLLTYNVTSRVLGDPLAGHFTYDQITSNLMNAIVSGSFMNELETQSITVGSTLLQQSSKLISSSIAFVSSPQVSKNYVPESTPTNSPVQQPWQINNPGIPIILSPSPTAMPKYTNNDASSLQSLPHSYIVVISLSSFVAMLLVCVVGRSVFNTFQNRQNKLEKSLHIMPCKDSKHSENGNLPPCIKYDENGNIITDEDSSTTTNLSRELDRMWAILVIAMSSYYHSALTTGTRNLHAFLGDELGVSCPLDLAYLDMKTFEDISSDISSIENREEFLRLAVIVAGCNDSSNLCTPTPTRSYPATPGSVFQFDKIYSYTPGKEGVNLMRELNGCNDVPIFPGNKGRFQARSDKVGTIDVVPHTASDLNNILSPQRTHCGVFPQTPFLSFHEIYDHTPAKEGVNAYIDTYRNIARQQQLDLNDVDTTPDIPSNTTTHTLSPNMESVLHREFPFHCSNEYNDIKYNDTAKPNAAKYHNLKQHIVAKQLEQRSSFVSSQHVSAAMETVLQREFPFHCSNRHNDVKNKNLKYHDAKYNNENKQIAIEQSSLSSRQHVWWGSTITESSSNSNHIYDDNNKNKNSKSNSNNSNMDLQNIGQGVFADTEHSPSNLMKREFPSLYLNMRDAATSSAIKDVLHRSGAQLSVHKEHIKGVPSSISLSGSPTAIKDALTLITHVMNHGQRSLGVTDAAASFRSNSNENDSNSSSNSSSGSPTTEKVLQREFPFHCTNMHKDVKHDNEKKQIATKQLKEIATKHIQQQQCNNENKQITTRQVQRHPSTTSGQHIWWGTAGTNKTYTAMNEHNSSFHSTSSLSCVVPDTQQHLIASLECPKGSQNKNGASCLKELTIITATTSTTDSTRTKRMDTDKIGVYRCSSVGGVDSENKNKSSSFNLKEVLSRQLLKIERRPAVSSDPSKRARGISAHNSPQSNQINGVSNHNSPQLSEHVRISAYRSSPPDEPSSHFEYRPQPTVPSGDSWGAVGDDQQQQHEEKFNGMQIQKGDCVDAFDKSVEQYLSSPLNVAPSHLLSNDDKSAEQYLSSPLNVAFDHFLSNVAPHHPLSPTDCPPILEKGFDIAMATITKSSDLTLKEATNCTDLLVNPTNTHAAANDVTAFAASMPSFLSLPTMPFMPSNDAFRQDSLRSSCSMEATIDDVITTFDGSTSALLSIPTMSASLPSMSASLNLNLSFEASTVLFDEIKFSPLRNEATKPLQNIDVNTIDLWPMRTITKFAESCESSATTTAATSAATSTASTSLKWKNSRVKQAIATAAKNAHMNVNEGLTNKVFENMTL